MPPLHIVADARRIRDFGIGTYIRSLMQALSAMDTTNRYTLVIRPEDTAALEGLPENFSCIVVPHALTASQDFSRAEGGRELKRRRRRFCHCSRKHKQRATPSRIRLHCICMTAKKTFPPENAPRKLLPSPLFFLTSAPKLSLFGAISADNDRAWFQPRKAQFEAESREPMLAVVRKMTDAMAEFQPNHVRKAEKSPSASTATRASARTNGPDKTHVAAWWTHTVYSKTNRTKQQAT